MGVTIPSPTIHSATFTFRTNETRRMICTTHASDSRLGHGFQQPLIRQILWVYTQLLPLIATTTFTSLTVYNTGYDVRHATVQGYKTGSVARTAVTGATCMAHLSCAAVRAYIESKETAVLSGTPTVDTNNVTYTMTATSSTGLSKSGEFMLWVTLMAPDISYTGSPFVFNKDVAITDIVVTNNGDTSFWAVSPNLPTGLSIDSSGTISGTPTDYISYPSIRSDNLATNSGGQSSTNITLTVVEAPRFQT